MEPQQLDQLLRQLTVLIAHQDTLNTKLTQAITHLTEVVSQLAVLVDTHLHAPEDD